MDIEKGKIINPEDKKTVENREEFHDEVEVISEKLDSIGNKAEDLITKGEQQIERIEAESKLSDEQIDSVKEEIGFVRRWKDLQNKAGRLVASVTEKIFGADFSEKEKLKIEKDDRNMPVTNLEGIFSPEEEVRNILKLPRWERREALDRFREKLAYQKEGLARIQDHVIEEIRKDPDASLSELCKIVESTGVKYGMNMEQKYIAEILLSAYVDKHRRVKTYREKFKNTDGSFDDKALFKEIFDKEPVGKIEVIEGPITLYFRCENLDDYALISSQAFLREPDERELTEEDREEAEKSGGISIASGPWEIEGSIIAENVSSKGSFGFDDVSKGIMDHEEQHAIKKLFDETFTELAGSTIKLNVRLRNTKDEAERQKVLKKYFREERVKLADERAKDEILAYLKQGVVGDDVVKNLLEPRVTDEVRGTIAKLEEEKENLSFFQFVRSSEISKEIKKIKEENGGLYDYLSEEKPHLDFSGEFRNTVKMISDEVYGPEYKKLLSEAAGSVSKLSYEARMTNDEISALLIQEPLTNWKKISDRILKDRKSKNFV